MSATGRFAESTPLNQMPSNTSLPDAVYIFFAFSNGKKIDTSQLLAKCTFVKLQGDGLEFGFLASPSF
jgi:hypothetical protein